MRIRTLITLCCVAAMLSGCGSPEERAAAHLATAQELFDEGDYVSARLEAQNAAQIQPKSASARYLLALVAEREGQISEMLQHLEVAVAEDPGMVDARVRLGTLYVFGRAYGRASEQAEAATRLAPGDPDVLVLNARLLLQRGETAAGLAALNEAIAREPGHLVAVGMKALILQQSGPDRALAFLDTLIPRLEPAEAGALQQLKLDILFSNGRTEDIERALVAMIEDAPDGDPALQSRLARFYWNQGRFDEAERMLRDLAAAVDADSDAQLNLVRFLVQTGRPGDAAKVLQTLIEREPENTELQIALGDLYIDQDRRDEAVAIYREVAALDPLAEPGLLARTKLVAERMRSGDTDGAGELLRGILSDAPDYPQALLMRAGQLYAEQRYDGAIADLRILLRKDPDNQRGLLLLARSHVAAGDVVLGKDAYRKLLALNPGLAAATRELVTLMTQDSEYDEAEAVLAQLAEQDAGRLVAGVMMVRLLVQQGDWAAAESEARRLADGDDPNGVGTFQLGQVLEGRGRYPEAADAFARALDKNPDSIPMLQGLARSLNAQGKQDETIAELRRRSVANPEHPGIRVMLGGALAERGDSAEALQVLNALMSEQPAFVPTYVAVASLYPEDAAERITTYRRGLAARPGDLTIGALLVEEYQNAGRIDELIDLYESLHAEHPDNPDVANNLASLLADYRYDDPAGVARAVQLADGLAGTDDPLIMDTVGWAYYRGGDNAQAVRYLERSVAAVTDMPVLRYHLGMAYLAAGDRVGAKQELEKAVASGGVEFDGIDEARGTLDMLEDG